MPFVSWDPEKVKRDAEEKTQAAAATEPPKASLPQIKALQKRVGDSYDLKACKEALNSNGCDLDRAERALTGDTSAEAAAAVSTPQKLLTYERLRELQEDALADDVPITDEMLCWTETQARDFFESGGV